MASVTQCDICGNVVKHEQSKYIKIFDVTSDDRVKDNTAICKELCPACYKKIAKIINKE